MEVWIKNGKDKYKLPASSSQSPTNNLLLSNGNFSEIIWTDFLVLTTVSHQYPLHIQSISSKVWMVLSDWPSVWGWKVVLKSNLVPKALCNSCQPVNRVHLFNWRKVSCLCQSVNYQPYYIIAPWCMRQPTYKIYGNHVSLPLWNR